MKTPYIIIDGIDGCGKSTQVEMLSEWLRDRYGDVLVVSEPHEGTEIGMLTRKILRTGEYPEALLGMMVASRFDLQSRIIAPALRQGIPVVSSRGFLSTLVYQGAKYPLSVLVALHCSMPQYPTHGIILDVPPETAVARIQKRDHKEVFENANFLKYAASAYRDIARSERVRTLFGNNLHLVNSMPTKESTFEHVLNALGLK